MNGLPVRALAVLLLWLAPACVSFPGHRLERLDPAREITAENRLPAISYECKTGLGTSPPDWNLDWPGASTERMFQSAFLDARSGPAANDLHAELHFQSETQRPIFWMGVAQLAVVTLGLIPAYIPAELTLLVRVENEGKLMREYVYQEDLDFWYEIFLLPWSFSHDAVEMRCSVYENMLLHFLRDLRRDLAQEPAGLVRRPPGARGGARGEQGGQGGPCGRRCAWGRESADGFEAWRGN